MMESSLIFFFFFFFGIIVPQNNNLWIQINKLVLVTINLMYISPMNSVIHFITIQDEVVRIHELKFPY